MHNLCSFDVVVSGEIFPKHDPGIAYEPILESAGRFQRLLGYEQQGLPEVLPAGTDVIVPRMSAAVGSALAAGLVPHCVPLSGSRDPKTNTFTCAEVEPAPAGLALPVLPRLPDAAGDAPVVRAVFGPYPMLLVGLEDLPEIPKEHAAIRLPDGSIQLPPAPPVGHGLLIPNDGEIVSAVAAAFPASVIYVTDRVVQGQRTRIFRLN